MDYKEFLEEVKLTKSPNTYDSYVHALARFPQGTREEIAEYIARKDVKDSTKQQHLRILLLALKWYELDSKEIHRLIKSYRPNEEIQPCPKDEDVDKIWNSIHTDRERFIFALLAYNGLRISEVEKLNIYDVGEETIRLRNTKGKHDDHVPLVHERVLSSMKQWVETRKAINSNSPALFINMYGNRLSLSYLKKWVKQICVNNDLPEFHAHSFRRYFANTLSLAGVNLQDMKECMRHRSVDTTMRYLNINTEDLRKTLRKVYAHK